MFRSLTILAALLVAPGCSKPKNDTGAPAPGPSTSSSAKFRPPADPVPPAPKGLPPVVAPDDNPITSDKMALGRQLFFDKRLSHDGVLACSSCHGLGTPPEAGAVAAPEPGKPPPRVAPPLWNVGYLKAFYWDGRATGPLEDVVLAEWGSHGMGTKDKLGERAQALGRVPAYTGQFKRLFPKDGVTPDNVAKVLATFLRTLTCGDSAFDRFKAGDATALEGQPSVGWALFQGAAGCAECHAPPFFSNAYSQPVGFSAVGIGMTDRTRGADTLDPGRAGVTKNDADFGAFRTPSLRNLRNTAPYFHDGSVPTVEAAVIRMASRVSVAPTTAPEAESKPSKAKSKGKATGLQPHELQSLIDFMGALECARRVERPELPPSG